MTTYRYTFTTPDGFTQERVTTRRYDSVLVARPSFEYALLSASFRDLEVDSRNWAWQKAVDEAEQGTSVVYLGKTTLVVADSDLKARAATFLAQYPTPEAYSELTREQEVARVEQRKNEGYFNRYQVISYHGSPSEANMGLAEVRSSQVWAAPLLLPIEGVSIE